jgi:sulfide dehydrogenase cytochrome subunit
MIGKGFLFSAFVIVHYKTNHQMHRKVFKSHSAAALLLAASVVLSCQKSLTPKEKLATDVMPLAESASVTISPELQGRALAANCFQCHGTNGYASELKIAGINASALQSKFAEMRARGARDNIMNVHAFAYTTEEVNLIGNFFSQQ